MVSFVLFFQSNTATKSFKLTFKFPVPFGLGSSGVIFFLPILRFKILSTLLQSHLRSTVLTLIYLKNEEWAGFEPRTPWSLCERSSSRPL